MWYFSWILGLGLASTFGVLNAIWYDVNESRAETNATNAANKHKDKKPLTR